MLGTLSKLYERIINRRNIRYDEHRRPIVQVTVPVISVGNLTVGGTGKTVVVQMIVDMLRQRGFKPAVVMRGYKRSTRRLLVVHDGTSILASPKESGDEAALHAQKLNVPVVVAESKVDAAVYAAGFLPCDVIVVDDGYQHRSLHRDVDIVLIDKATVSEQRLLPAGLLREPITSLYRADVVLVMDPEIDRSLFSKFLNVETPVCGVGISCHCPTDINVPVVSLCAIAHPQRFRKKLADCGLDVVHSIEFRDHHYYTKSDIENVISVAKKFNAAVVTTEKDDVKLAQAHQMFVDNGVMFRVVPIKANLIDNKEEFDNIIFSRINHENSSQ